MLTYAGLTNEDGVAAVRMLTYAVRMLTYALTYAGLTNEDDVAAIRAFSRSLLHMLRDLADFNRIVAEIDTGRLC